MTIPVNPNNFDLQDVTVQALEQATGVIRSGTLAVAEAARPASVSVPGFSEGIDFGWLHGVSGGFVETWKTVAFLISLVLGIIFISIWMRLWALNKPQRPITEQLVPPQPAAGGPLAARWEEILRHLDSVKETEWKFALIEADKLVDDTLRRAGFPGDSFADRLEQVQPGQLAHIDNLWEAHRLRNRVAHDVNFFLRYTEAKRAIAAYTEVLKELSAV